MSKTRPINRSPFRRKPWARKKRPTRWNAVTNGLEISGAKPVELDVYPAIADGNAALITLIDGQVDVEPWADDQEITVDRIVGNIALYGHVSSTLDPPSWFQFPQMLYKAGIVVNEEVSFDATDVVKRNLFDQEDFEDTEWMWLSSGVLEHTFVQGTADSGGFVVSANIPVDLRNRRKVGQKDELALYLNWVVTASNYQADLRAFVDVRAIMMSR